MQRPTTSTTSSSISGRFTRYGVWFLLPIAAVAWFVVLATAVSIMGTARVTGSLIDAASLSAIAAVIAVPILAGFAILLDINKRHRAAWSTRVATFAIVALLLVVVASLLGAAVMQASAGA